MFKDVLLDVNELKCVSLKHTMGAILRLYFEKTSFLCKSNDLILGE
jgi:hypothetical protein